MDIPLNVTVFCTDGRAGTSSNVLINPVTSEITHLVVRLDRRKQTEVMVPIDKIGETTPASINVELTAEQLGHEEAFSVTYVVPMELPHYDKTVFRWPLVQTEHAYKQVPHHQIPLGELAVHRGAEVEATDGSVGKIEEFVVNTDGHITHLVIRNGHFWERSDVVIPLSDVESFHEEKVRLKLDKQQVEALPTIEIRR